MKPQTRRTHKRAWKIGKNSVRDKWFTKAQTHIIITRKFKQRLSKISQEDMQKEGYTSREDFKKAWTEIYGKWNPEQEVTVYEFKKMDEPPGLPR